MDSQEPKKRVSYYLKVSNVEKLHMIAKTNRRKKGETLDMIIEAYENNGGTKDGVTREN